MDDGRSGSADSRPTYDELRKLAEAAHRFADKHIVVDPDVILALLEERRVLRERVEAWAGSVRRLVAAAPIRAVVEEVGLPESGHTTPPERDAIREEALRVVDQWLARDLAGLQAEPARAEEGAS